MADTNWQIVEVGHRDTRIMLDLRDPSASYFNIHYIDMAGDETYVEYVHNIDIFGGEERVEIDRCAGNKFGPVGDHEKAIRQEIKKRGLHLGTTMGHEGGNREACAW